MAQDDKNPLISLVREIINDSTSEQATMRDTDYVNYEDYYDGRQLDDSTESQRSNQKAYNVCRPKVDAIASICTDQRAQVEMIPRDGQSPEKAAIANLIMDWIRDQAHFDDRIDLAHQESVKMNVAFEEALWLAGPEGIGGKPWGVLHSPRRTAWDFGASSPDEQRWTFIWKFLPKAYIKRRYENFDMESPVRNCGITDATVTGAESDKMTKGKVLFIKGYMRPEGYQYKKGWPLPEGMNRIVIAGNQELEHVGVGRADDDIPIVPFRFRPQAGQIEGVSLLHDLIGIQDDINNLIWIMKRTCEVAGPPFAKMRQGAYDKLADKYTNDLMKIVPVSDIGDLVVEKGIGFPAEMLSLLREMYGAADRVTLFRDISEAVARGTRVSGRGIRAAQEVNLSALRRTIREYENSIKMLAMIHFKNFIKYGGMAQISVDREQATDILKQIGAGTPQGPMAPQQEMGAYTVIPISANDLDGAWDMKVVVTPKPPMGRAAQREQVLAEFQVGLRDKQSALKELNISDWREIMQRDREKEMMMMQMQMAQAAQQGAQGGPSK